MLTESGFRESLAEERVQKAFAAAGASADALATLVDRRLLRIEERLDLRRVELTHDVLCSVVRGEPQPAPRARGARRGRAATCGATSAHAGDAQGADARAADRRGLRGARQSAPPASAIFGYFSMKRAQEAEAQAQQTRAMAESARGEAEKLIVYLLDDFYLELEPVGRLDIVAELAKRAVDYYAALPPELRMPKPIAIARWRWCATARVLRTQSKLDEAGKALAEAVAVLDKLRREGDQSEDDGHRSRSSV